MKHMSILIVALALMSCSDTSHEPPAPSSEAAMVESQTADAVPTQPVGFQSGDAVSVPDFAVPGARLSVSPNPFRACDFPRDQGVVTIEYDARDAGAKHTQIWFQRRNGKQDLWGQAPGRMTATPTANWAHDGMRVLLVDLDASTVLAVTTIHAEQCE